MNCATTNAFLLEKTITNTNVRGAMNCATTNAFLLEKNITNTNVRGAMNCATTNAFLLEKNITNTNVRGAMNCATTNAFLLEKTITNTNVRGAMNCATTNAFLLEKNHYEHECPRLAQFIAPLTLVFVMVFSRRNAFVVAQFIAPLTFKRSAACPRRNELRDYERVFCLCDVIIEKWYYIIAPKFYEQQQYLYESVVLTPVHPRICVRSESFQ